jgi:thiamine biosynthesis protein ThiC
MCVIIAAICGLGAAIACLVMAAREMELPDLEDIETGE